MFFVVQFVPCDSRSHQSFVRSTQRERIPRYAMQTHNRQSKGRTSYGSNTQRTTTTATHWRLLSYTDCEHSPHVYVR